MSSLLSRPFPRLLLSLIALGVVAAVVLGWKHHSRDRAWAAVRPALPAALGNAAPGLDARLAGAAARFHDAPPDVSALAEFARVCHANGHLDAAIAAYRALLALQPAEPRWPHLLASILAGYGQLDDALPLLRQTTALAPDYLAGWLKLGDALLKSNATADAEAAYREILQRDSTNHHALLGLARCDLQNERLTSARGHLQRAVAHHPDFASAQSLLGTVFERLGNPDAAAIARARVQQGGHYAEHPDPWAEELAFESHDPYTLLTAASAAVAENKLPRARRLLERGLSFAPDDARLRRQFGKALAIDGDYAGSRRELARAVALEPANDALRFDLLAILRRTGDDEAFSRVVAEGLAISPGSVGLRYEAGRLAAQVGRLDEAIAHLELSWRDGPEQSAAGLELAEVYFRHGRSSDAVNLLEDVLMRFPKDHAAHLRQIRLGIETGDSRTVAWLERASRADVPAPLLAELRAIHRGRFGASQP